MEYIYPLTAIHMNGETKLLRNKEDAVNFYYKHGRWHTYHGEVHPLYEYYYRKVWISHWIVRDDWGRPVDYNDIKPVYNYSSYWKRRQKEVRRCKELGLPIPGTGRRWKRRTHNAPAKKNGGTLQRARAASKYKQEIKEYDLPKKVRGTNYYDPWDWY